MKTYALAHYVFLAALWVFISAMIYKMFKVGRLFGINAESESNTSVLIRHMGHEYRRRMAPRERIIIGRAAESHVRIDAQGLPLQVGSLIRKAGLIIFSPTRAYTATLNGKALQANEEVTMEHGEKLNLLDLKVEIEVLS